MIFYNSWWKQRRDRRALRNLRRDLGFFMPETLEWSDEELREHVHTALRALAEKNWSKFSVTADEAARELALAVLTHYGAVLSPPSVRPSEETT